LSHNNDNITITPLSFKKTIANINPMWGEIQHQDSQEFLIFIISQLEEELGNQIDFIPGRIILNTYTKITPKDIYRICGLEKNKKDFSIIKELFIGSYSSNIICNFCKTYTPNFENFITLSVDIPLNLGQIISLNDCLKYTFKNEVFDSSLSSHHITFSLSHQEEDD
jgi:ubiquitin C-terminal hydrolase